MRHYASILKREPAIKRLSDERQKAAFKAMIAEILLKSFLSL